MTETKDPEIRRWINSKRFRWHEAVLRDANVHRVPTAILLAGHVMHRFKPEEGFAQFSSASAAKALNITSRSVIRAKDVLMQRGWISLHSTADRKLARWAANKYAIGGGPEDLLFDDDD